MRSSRRATRPARSCSPSKAVAKPSRAGPTARRAPQRSVQTVRATRPRGSGSAMRLPSSRLTRQRRTETPTRFGEREKRDDLRRDLHLAQPGQPGAQALPALDRHSQGPGIDRPRIRGDRPGMGDQGLRGCEVLEQGDKVAMFGSFTYRGRESGKEITSLFPLFAKVKDGKAFYIQFSKTRSAPQRPCLLPEDEPFSTAMRRADFASARRWPLTSPPSCRREIAILEPAELILEPSASQ